MSQPSKAAADEKVELLDMLLRSYSIATQDEREMVGYSPQPPRVRRFPTGLALRIRPAHRTMTTAHQEGPLIGAQMLAEAGVGDPRLAGQSAFGPAP